MSGRKKESAANFLLGMITGASLLVFGFAIQGGKFPAPFETPAEQISIDLPDASGLSSEARTRVAKSLKTFLETFVLVERDHVSAQLDEDLVAKMLDGALHRLDPYSGFMDAERVADLTSPPEEERALRLGISIMDVDGGYTIEAVSPGSPAEQADLRPGDRVVRVGETDVAELAPAKINTIIRKTVEDTRGKDIELGISRPGMDAELSRVVRPAPFPEIPVLDLGLHDGVLHLAIERFYQGMAEDVRAAIERARETGAATGVAIDLRDNSGGLTTEARLLAEMFLPKGSLLYEMHGREGSLAEIHSEQNPTYPELGLSVIVNGNSASASEIFAAAIQAHQRGLVVGWQTYGKGSIQRIYPVDGGSIKITVAKYKDAALRQIDGQGVTPDIEIPQEDPEMRLSRFVPDPARREALDAAAGAR